MSETRSNLIHRPPAKKYEGREIREFFMALASAHSDDALREEAARFIDFAEAVAHDSFRRNKQSPGDWQPSKNLSRDGELDFARDVLERAQDLRSALQSNFAGWPAALIAVRCFGLANAVAELQIEFGLGRRYRAGAKTIAGAAKAGQITAEKRRPAIEAKHQHWRELSAEFNHIASLSRRAELIQKQVAGTPHHGAARTIRAFLAK